MTRKQKSDCEQGAAGDHVADEFPEAPPPPYLTPCSIWFPILLCVAGLVAYANSFSAAFVFDNVNQIENNTHIRSFANIDQILFSRRPVTEFTLAVNYAIGELHTRGYVVFNVIVHLLAGMTLFGVIHRLLNLERWDGRYRQSATWIALAISAIWLVHPLQTQSVTYIIQRAEALMGLFYLLTLYCVIRGVTGERSTWWFVFAIACCGLGMGCKAVMVTAPVIVLLFDRVFLASSWRELFGRRIVLYLGLFATWAVLFGAGVVKGVFYPAPTQAATVGFGNPDVSAWHYALTQPKVILTYLRLAFLPIGQCLDYQWPANGGIGQALPYALGLLVLLVATVYALWRKPVVGIIAASFFIILAPTSSFIPIRDVIFEHRMYLPLAAVIALVVLGVHALIVQRVRRATFSEEGGRGLAGVLMVLAVVVLTATTIARNRVYRTKVRMWEDIASKSPNNGRAQLNLGGSYVQEGRYTDALAAFDKALVLAPKDASIYNNIGLVYFERGDLDKAEEAFDHAKTFEPDNSSVWLQFGNLRVKQHRPEEALACFERAIQLDRRSVVALDNKGWLLISMKRYEEALKLFDRALALRPDFATVYYHRGVALQRLGRLDEAIKALQQAAAGEFNIGDPDRAQALMRLGEILLGMDRQDEAISAFDRALVIVPNRLRAPFHQRYAQALSKHGLNERAADQLREVIRLRPDDEAAKLQLARLNVLTADTDTAIRNLRRLIEADPESAELHRRLAQTLVKAGRASEAVPPLQKALQLDPKDGDAQFLLGVTIANEGRYGDAEPYLRRAVGLLPHAAKARSALGRTYIHLGRADDAIEQLERLLEIDPKANADRMNLASLYEHKNERERALELYVEAARQDEKLFLARVKATPLLSMRGKLDQAERFAREATEIKPQDVGAWNNLAVVLRSRQKYDEALAAYDKAIELSPLTNPRLADTYYNRGNLLASLNRVEEAVADYESCLALQPDHARAAAKLAAMRP